MKRWPTIPVAPRMPIGYLVCMVSKHSSVQESWPVEAIFLEANAGVNFQTNPKPERGEIHALERQGADLLGLKRPGFRFRVRFRVYDGRHSRPLTPRSLPGCIYQFGE